MAYVELYEISIGTLFGIQIALLCLSSTNTRPFCRLGPITYSGLRIPKKNITERIENRRNEDNFLLSKLNIK